MKLVIKYIIISLVMAFTLNASEVAGNWLLTKIEEKNGVKEDFMEVSFNKDGSMVMMGWPIGTWIYDKNTKKIVVKSKVKGYSGDNHIVKLDKKTLVLKNGDTTTYYMRLIAQDIKKANETSHLVGSWKVALDGENIEVFRFELPDKFSHVKTGGGATETTKGTWIYNPEDNTLLVASIESPIQGFNSIKKNGNALLINNKRRGTLKLTKSQSSQNKIERLNFTYKDFPENPASLPSAWQDFGFMAQALENIEYIQYKLAKLIVKANTFKYSSTRSTIKVDASKPKVKFSNFTMQDGEVDEQYSQNYKGGLSERYNNFFPLENPSFYRVLGDEEITVGAGTFKCSVVEAVNGDKKMKLWLIIDKPGIYAKKIVESEGSFSEVDYLVFELEKIQNR